MLYQREIPASWSRLKPFHQSVKMIERHGDSIVSYCNSSNKVSPGLVEGINNKVCVIQRRAYGIKDREYLKLKILSSFLPEL
ncbi:ISL3 family transposase [Candidatus Brocadia sapporoensis]|uniref:ISL3 family transposase n=1 Tax=Candidatus Brocadia sapporoensis TaxID=392547 RepID=A0A1V6LX57_9BACT|nr:ISL3 family transposase [Candidatus Brocadia sapporoensis]